MRATADTLTVTQRKHLQVTVESLEIPLLFMKNCNGNKLLKKERKNMVGTMVDVLIVNVQWENGQPLGKNYMKKNHPHILSSDMAEGESKISTSAPRLGLLRPCPQTYHQSRPFNSLSF